MFTVFSKKSCPYCVKAISFIREELCLTPAIFDVSEYPDAHCLVIESTGHKTVPAIYIGENFIGGYDDLKSMHDNKSLKTLILEEEGRLLKLRGPDYKKI